MAKRKLPSQVYVRWHEDGWLECVEVKDLESRDHGTDVGQYRLVEVTTVHCVPELHGKK